MEKTQYELEHAGKTYTLRKMNPFLKSQFAQAVDSVQKLAATFDNQELGHASGILQHVTPLIWAFLTPDDKKSIGTFDEFLDNVDEAQIGKFFNWAAQECERAKLFLETEKTGNPVPA